MNVFDYIEPILIAVTLIPSNIIALIMLMDPLKIIDERFEGCPLILHE